MGGSLTSFSLRVAPTTITIFAPDSLEIVMNDRTRGRWTEDTHVDNVPARPPRAALRGRQEGAFRLSRMRVLHHRVELARMVSSGHGSKLELTEQGIPCHEYDKSGTYMHLKLDERSRYQHRR